MDSYAMAILRELNLILNPRALLTMGSIPGLVRDLVTENERLTEIENDAVRKNRELNYLRRRNAQLSDDVNEMYDVLMETVNDQIATEKLVELWTESAAQYARNVDFWISKTEDARKWANKFYRQILSLKGELMLLRSWEPWGWQWPIHHPSPYSYTYTTDPAPNNSGGSNAN